MSLSFTSLPFIDGLSTGPVPLGTWLMAASPATAEALGALAFDWLLIDMEHVPIDDKELWHLLCAIQCTSAHAVVRVAKNDAALIKRALDLGASSIMVPFIENEQQARDAVSAMRYPPEGTRGFAAVHRASRYGVQRDYAQQANAHTCCILQIETPHALEQLEAIATVSGVDALFLGPGDLSANCGHLGNPEHADVQHLIEQAVERAHALNVPIGIVGPSPERVQHYLALGYDFVAMGSDMSMMMAQARTWTAHLHTLRSA